MEDNIQVFEDQGGAIRTYKVVDFHLATKDDPLTSIMIDTSEWEDFYPNEEEDL